ncbi:hypothetical protein HZS_5826, partial [Henneguya salminicola]
MRNLTQDSFWLIKEYIQALDDTTNKWSIATKATKWDVERKRSDLFFAGLSPITVLEMQKLGLEEEEAIVNRITELEDTLLRSENSYTESKVKTFLQPKALPSKTPVKWCNYHKSSFHDDSECRRKILGRKKQFNPKEKTDSKPSEKALMIREPTKEIKEISLEGTLNGSEIKVLIDTGARNNYINQPTADGIGLEIVHVSNNKNVELADGNFVSIVGNAKGCLKLTEFPLYEFHEEFVVIQGSLKDVLLGSPFLNRNDVMIDYRSKQIRIVDHVLLLDVQHQSAWIENPDCDIKERVCNLNQLSPKLETLSRIASEERKRDRLGVIPNVSMKIVLDKFQPISKAPYPKIYEYLGHPGSKSLCETIRRFLNVPNLNKIAQSLRTRCNLCQRYQIAKRNYGKLYGKLQTEVPFEHLCTDIVGPIPTSSFTGSHQHQKFWVLTLMDRCTHWVDLWPIYDLKPETFIRHLKEWCSKYGNPKTLLSDQGRTYTSKHLSTEETRLGIKHKFTTAYNPTGNGMSERINQSINFVLKHFNERSISKAIETAERRLRLCYHRGLKCSPFELVYQSHPCRINEKIKTISPVEATRNNIALSNQNTHLENDHRQIDWTPTP